MAAGYASDYSLSEEIEFIASISWDRGKLACSYYNLSTMELFVTHETPDIAPHFSLLRDLIRQIKPRYILSSGPNHFLKELMIILEISEDSNLMNYHVNSKRNLSSISNFWIYPKDEKNLMSNRQRILELQLPGMPEDLIASDRRLFFETVFPMHQELIVQSLGNLLQYLDKNSRQIFLRIDAGTIITDVKVVFLESQVLMDDITFNALQIFSNMVHHPSGFKQGSSTSAKQGPSVFQLYNRCCSKLGTQTLQTLLSQPSRDVTELNLRYKTIEWCMSRDNSIKVQTLQDYLRKISDVGQLYRNLVVNNDKIRDWNLLKKTVYNITMIYNYCIQLTSSNQESSGTLISDIANVLVDNLTLQNVLIILDTTVDLEEGMNQGKFLVKFGVDAELDEKKEEMILVQDKLQEAVQQEADNLPDFINQMSGYYIPETGYVIKIKILNDDPPLEELKRHNLTYITKVDNEYFFKTSLCDELNKTYGHLYPRICEHESRICGRLLKVLKEDLPAIQIVVKLCTKLDCLIAFASVAVERNLIRPEITAEKCINIKGGRHILWEIRQSFIPNDTDISADKNNLISILIAPNGSGKSVYLKQVALIAYLAHVGSFVPAKYAQIALLDSIYSRIDSPESAYTATSSFLADLQQMAKVMNNSNERSLLLIDEFGKGTNVSEGKALLLSFIESLQKRNKDCPFVLLTTHYTEIYDFLPEKSLISLQTFITYCSEASNKQGLKSTFKLKPGGNVNLYATKIEAVKDFLDELFKDDKITTRSGDDDDVINGDPFSVIKIRVAYDMVKYALKNPNDVEGLENIFKNAKIE